MERTGQAIILYYDDGERITRKDGIVTSEDSEFFILDHRIMIPKDRIIRGELK